MGRFASLAKRASDWIGHLSNVQWAWGLIVISVPGILAFIRHEPAWYVAALLILMAVAVAVLFFAWDIWRRGGRQRDFGLQPPKPPDVTKAAPKARPSQKHPSPSRSGLFDGFLNPIPDSAFKDLAERLESDIAERKAGHLDNQRRKLISDCRDLAVAFTNADPSANFRAYMESQRAFADVRRHLSPGYLKMLNAQRTFYVAPDGARHPVLVQSFLNEIDHLEQEWGLQ